MITDLYLINHLSEMTENDINLIEQAYKLSSRDFRGVDALIELADTKIAADYLWGIHLDYWDNYHDL